MSITRLVFNLLIVIMALTIFQGCLDHDCVEPPREWTLTEVTDYNSPCVFLIWVNFTFRNVTYEISIDDNSPEKKKVEIMTNCCPGASGFAVTRKDVLTNSHVTSSQRFFKEKIEQIIKYERNRCKTNNVKISKSGYESCQREVFIIHANWKKPVKAISIKESTQADLSWLHVDEDLDIAYPLVVSTVEPHIGNVVYALGYPVYASDLSQEEMRSWTIMEESSKRPITGTQGYINKNRALYAGDISWGSVGKVYEHSAKINPGNSGGPLFDVFGNVIGVNSCAIDSAHASFCVAMTEVKTLFPELWERIQEFNPVVPQVEGEGQ